MEGTPVRRGWLPWLVLAIFTMTPWFAAASVLTPAQLNLPLYGTSAVWDGSTKAYVFGGIGPGGSNSGSRQILTYEPASQTTAVLPTTLLATQKWGAAVRDRDVVYLFGGDTAIDRFRLGDATIDRLPVALPQPRSFMGAASVGGAHFLVGGLEGENSPLPPPGTRYSSNITRFDPVNLTVTNVAQLPVRVAGPLVAAANGSVFIFGGELPGSYIYTDRIWKFDPETSVVTELSARLPSALCCGAAVWDNGQYVWLLGGGGPARRDTVWRYDIVTDSLTSTSYRLPSARVYLSGVADCANPFVFGGKEGDVGGSDGVVSRQIVKLALRSCPPKFEPLPTFSAQEGGLLTFDVSATDPDSLQLSFSSASLPPGATFNTATRRFSWNVPCVSAGEREAVFAVTDGQHIETTTAQIDVAPADCAPTLVPLPDRTLPETLPATIDVAASDPDGDQLTLAVMSGMPEGATFVDFGNGRGQLNWTPRVGDAIHELVIQAEANGVTVASRFNVTVVPLVALEVARVGPAVVSVGAEVVHTLTATLTNRGTRTDVLTLLAKADRAGWTLGLPESMTLAPGQSANVSWTVTSPRDGDRAQLDLIAASSIDPSVSHSARWRLDMPVGLTLTVTSHDPPDRVTGTVGAYYLNGVPVERLNVTVRQTPWHYSGGTSSVSGVSRDGGNYTFDFGMDLRASIPGYHAVFVNTSKAGTLPATKTGGYTVIRWV